ISFNAGSDTFNLCRSESITTSRANDLILVLADCTGCSQSSTTTPSVDSVFDQSGLSFTQRYSYVVNSGLWEIYAVAPSPLTNDNVTVTFSNVGGNTNIHVLAVTGVDFSSIFDPDPSLPSIAPCNPFANAQPFSCSTTFSTSGTDFVVASTPINDMAGCQTPPG